MKDMNIINLNQVRKIELVKKRKTDYYKWYETETFSQKIKNLFRKNKVKTKYVTDIWDTYFYDEDELDKFNEEHEGYIYDPILSKFYQKAHIVMQYANYSYQVRYFDTDKEAKAYFDKLVVYAKEHNVPFIDFYSEK
jgi:hypothetical protein